MIENLESNILYC